MWINFVYVKLLKVLSTTKQIFQRRKLYIWGDDELYQRYVADVVGQYVLMHMYVCVFMHAL